MKSLDLIQSFAEFKDQKNIDRETMKTILEDVFRAVLVKNYGSDENYDIIINVDKGDFEIYRILEVVADNEVTDENRQIALSKARLAADDYEIGEEYTEEIKFRQKYTRFASVKSYYETRRITSLYSPKPSRSLQISTVKAIRYAQ